MDAAFNFRQIGKHGAGK